MRVGVNTLFLIPGEVGGSETYLRDTLRHAVPRHADVEWVLFTNAENHDLLRGELGGFANVSLEPLRFAARNRMSRIVREQTQLPAAVARRRVDVLWSPGYTAPWRVRCPQVTSVLDMQYCEFPQDLTRMALWATRLLVPVAVRASRRVVTLSEFSRAQIVKYIKADPEAIQVIYPAVDGVFRRDMAAEERTRRIAKLGVSGPYVLCVANTYPHKNVHALIDAFGLLAREWPGRLVLVGGEGRGESLVAERLRGGDAADRVVRLHRLDRQDLVALYQGAACFAFPSLYEGFGLPVLEAMAAGAPVVTVGGGAVAEIGGDCVAYGDGSPAALSRDLRSVLTLDDAARREVVARARQRAALFTWERCADELVACLRACAA